MEKKAMGAENVGPPGGLKRGPRNTKVSVGGPRKRSTMRTPKFRRGWPKVREDAAGQADSSEAPRLSDAGDVVATEGLCDLRKGFRRV